MPLSDFASVLIAISTLVLVLVTHHYAKTTKEILLDNQKNRKIDQMKEKLEKLYYPLKGLLQENSLYNLEQEPSPLADFHKFQYLGEDNLKKAMDDYYRQYHSLPLDWDKTSKILTEMRDIVEKEIPLLQTELDELTK